jgi:hypothetical protein
MPDVPTVFLPADRRIEGAAWNGEFPRSGPFVRAVARVAGLIGEMAS